MGFAGDAARGAVRNAIADGFGTGACDRDVSVCLVSVRLVDARRGRLVPRVGWSRGSGAAEGVTFRKRVANTTCHGGVVFHRTCRSGSQARSGEVGSVRNDSTVTSPHLVNPTVWPIQSTRRGVALSSSSASRRTQSAD